MVSDETKGFRDHPPSLAEHQERIRRVIRDAATKYGYQPLDTPAIEARSILTSKFTGGEEILKEMYTLTDQGERELGLRYDLTVPFARFIAEHPELKHPFKRYQHGKVYRDGPVTKGRYREFEQFDLDVVGAKSPVYDAELIAIVDTVLTELSIPHRIELNTRGLLEAIIAHVGVEDSKTDTVILTLDKYEKKGRSGVADELSDKGLSDTTVDELLSILDEDGGNDELIAYYDEYGDISELQRLNAYLDAANVDYTLNPYLARGLTYYTGVVFEAFTTDDFDRSIAAGGRYDDMIGELSSHEDDLPAVGASFGVDTLIDAVGTKSDERDDTVYVIPLADTEEVIRRAERLRSDGVDVMLGDPDTSFGKHMDYADKEGLGYVLVIGDDELSTEEYTVKHLSTGEERTSGLGGVADSINALKQI